MVGFVPSGNQSALKLVQWHKPWLLDKLDVVDKKIKWLKWIDICGYGIPSTRGFTKVGYICDTLDQSNLVWAAR